MRPCFLWFVSVVLSLARCGGESPATLALRLRYPVSLKASEARFARFLERVAYVEIVATPEGGAPARALLPPGGGEGFRLPGLSGRTGKVEVRIWDRRRDGSPRPFAALEGSGAFSLSSPATEIPLRLAVSVREYD